MGNFQIIWFCNLMLAVHNAMASVCSRPSLINAVIDTTGKIDSIFKENSVLYYKCKDGYHFKDGSQKHKLLCNKQGTWEPRQQICYDSCNNLCSSGSHCSDGTCHCDDQHTGQYCQTRMCEVPTLSNLQINSELGLLTSGTKVKEGTHIVIVCNQGYSVKRGSSTHLCTSSGWNWPPNSPPVCERNTCKRLTIDNGSPSPDQMEYPYGSSIIFTCSPGYELSPSTYASASCGSNGVWSHNWPACREKKCPPFILQNGIIEPPNIYNTVGYSVDTALKLSCRNGYLYYGQPQNIRCQGPPTHVIVKWSSQPGKCITSSAYNKICGQEGKVLQITGGKAGCAFETRAPDLYTPVKSAVKKTERPLTIVTSTAGGLLLLLLLVITLVAFQRRRLGRLQRGRSGRHRMNSDEDRLSFVYYSNDVHVVLPSYDEAMEARRINNPPPYAPDEERTRETPLSTAIAPSSSNQNFYETIDEIRTTVNAVRDSLTTSIPLPPQPPSQVDGEEAVQGATAMEEVVQQTVSNDTETQIGGESEHVSDYGIYDDPDDEPIYASVQKKKNVSTTCVTDREARSSADLNGNETQENEVTNDDINSVDEDLTYSDTEPLL